MNAPSRFALTGKYVHLTSVWGSSELSNGDSPESLCNTSEHKIPGGYRISYM